ncbi:hypothetical protein AB1Y20_011134 [Prymnesium parvum]|uniref:U6 small nuclear RNA (adenine-(43)-N(6))-methyltransferase n=1 Tax=Prymnesium parvum TaxID=97485 RepID=A0AB34IP44_PRYPA
MRNRALMHPRNPYKRRAPDFARLATLYPDFARHLSWRSSDGEAQLDWSDPRATVALCRTLLLHDFGVRWELPEHRLCPTVPSRLNYLLWIEDLLSLERGTPAVHHAHQPSCDAPAAPLGVDVGTGASCIYPLLGTALLGWRFIATEIDALSVQAARENVARNGWEDRIEVRAVAPAAAHSEGTAPAASPLLVGVLREGETAHFVMCNPPFFDEAEVPKPRADGVAGCTAARTEQFTPGGEVGFVSRMIGESLQLRDRVTWYTSLVGRKASLAPLLRELRRARATHVRTTELAQGRTSRWAVAWSFVARAAPVSGEVSRCRRVFGVGSLRAAEVRRRLLEHVGNLPGLQRLDDRELEISIEDVAGEARVMLASGVVELHIFKRVPVPEPGKRQRNEAADTSDNSESSAATLAFEVWLHGAWPRLEELSLAHPPEGADAEHADPSSHCQHEELKMEIMLSPSQDEIRPSADGAAQRRCAVAFWPFAERMRNDVIRDTRKWRRLHPEASTDNSIRHKTV